MVDDREENLLALDALLSKSEFEPVWARSGEEALEAAKNKEFALVLLDVRMPDMDGFETLSRLRRLPGFINTPVIFVTAEGHSREQEGKAYQHGAVDIIYKPINPSILDAKIKVFINLYKGMKLKEQLAQTKHFLDAHSEMASLIRHKDWKAHSLGSPESWPNELKTSVSLMLSSGFPMFISWGDEGTFFYNDAYIPILGSEKHPKSLGAKFEDVWSDIWKELSPIADRVYLGESSYFEDLPLFMNRNGFFEQTYFTFSYSPIKDSNAEVTGLFCACVETTARKVAEDRLQRNEQNLRILANSIPQLAWVAEPDGNILWYNDRWYDYTGTTFEDMQGWGWEKVHNPELLPTMLPIWKRSLKKGDPWEDTFQLRGKDGNYRWFLSRAMPIRDSNGKILRWFGTNTDIDDQRNAEEKVVNI